MPVSNQFISYKISGISFVGSSADLNRNAGALAGTALASKTVILDSSLNYTGVNSFGANQLTGTLLTAAQPNITSTGTLVNLTTTGNLNISSHNGSSTGLLLGGNLVVSTATQLNYTQVTPGLGTLSRAVVLDGSRNITNINSMSIASMFSSGAISIGSNTNTNNYMMFIRSDGNSFTGLRLKNNDTTNTSSGCEIDFGGYKNDELNNYSLCKIRSVVSAGDTNNVKAGNLVFFTNDGVSTYNNSGYERMRITSTGFVGIGTNTPIYRLDILNTNGQMIRLSDGTNNTTISIVNDGGLNIVPSGGYVNVPALRINNTTLNASVTELNYLSGLTPGAATASKALIVDSSRNINNINNITVSQLIASGFTYGGTAITANAAQINALNVSPGVASASSVMVLNSSLNITGINILGLATLRIGGIDVIATSAQLNTLNTTSGTAVANFALITNSSNNITGINRIGASILQLGGTDITATATQLNYLASITPGTGALNKALVLDGSSNIGSINTLSATTLNGTLGTATQNNITSVGTLTGLTVSNAININKSTAGASIVINQNSNNDAIRLTYVDSVRTDLFTDSNGVFNINPSNSNSGVFISNGLTSNNNQILCIGNTTTTVDVSSNNALLRLLNHSGVNYIQSGFANSTGSAADLFIGDMLYSASGSPRKIMIKANGLIGFGTVAPTAFLQVNGSATSAILARFLNTAGLSFNITNETGAFSIGPVDSAILNLRTNNANRISIDGSGFTTIGSTVTTSTSPIFSITPNYKTGILQSWSPSAAPDSGITASTLSLYVNNSTTNLAGTWLGTTTDTPFYLFRNNSLGTAPILSNAYVALSGNFVNIPIHNGTNSGLQLNSVLVTSTANELNYVSGVSAGTGAADKAVILNSSRNIANIGQISTTGGITTSFLNNTSSIITYQTWINTGLVTTSLVMTSAEMRFGTASGGRFRLVCNGTAAITLETDNSTTIHGQLILGSTALSATATELNYLAGVTPGTAAVSKAMVLNSSGVISGVSQINLTGTNHLLTLNGTNTASIPRIHFVNDVTTWELGCRGTTASGGSNVFYMYQGNYFRMCLDINGNFGFGNMTSPICRMHVIDSGSGSVSYKTFQRVQNTTNSINCDIEINNVDAMFGTSTNHSLRLMTNDASRIIITNTGSVGIGNNSPGFTLDVSGSVNATSYNLSGLASNMLAITGVTSGTALANKALILNGSTAISGISSLSATSLTGQIQTADQPLITSLGNLSVLNVGSTVQARIRIDSTWVSFGTFTNHNFAFIRNNTYVGNWTATGLRIGDGNNPTQALDVSGSIVASGTINATAYQLSGTSLLMSSLTSVTAGAAAASKAIVLDSNANITSGFNSMLISGTDNLASDSVPLSIRTTAASWGLSVSNAGTIRTGIRTDGGIGTITNNDLVFYTNNAERLRIYTNGNIKATGSGYIEANTFRIVPTTRDISTFLANVGVLWHSTTGRFYGMRQIDNDNISLLSYGAGGNYDDYFTWNHNGGSPIVNIKTRFINVGPSNTDNTRMLSLLDGVTTTNSNRHITLGSANTTGNQAEFVFNYQGSNNSLNRLGLGFNSNNSILNVMNSKSVSINKTTASNAVLDIQCVTEFIQGDYNKGISLYSSNGSGPRVDILVSSTNTSSSASPGWIGTATTHDLRLGSNNSTRMTIEAGGNVSFNNTIDANRVRARASNNASCFIGAWDDNTGWWGIGENGTQTGISFRHCDSGGTTASGNITVSATTFNSTSDYRIKSDIQDLEYGLKDLLKLSSKRYILDNELKSCGFIAHELQEFIPEVVLGEKDGIDKYGQPIYQSVNYSAIVPILVNGIKELNEKNEQLTNRLDNIPVNTYSDIRLKKNIENLTDEYCLEFIKSTNPVKYKYKDSEKYSYGYIAQDLLKKDYTDFVDISQREGVEELIDEDNFMSPKDAIFNLNYNNIIPILAKTVQHLVDEKNELKEENILLKSRLETIEQLLFGGQN
mgnify:FL=1